MSMFYETVGRSRESHNKCTLRRHAEFGFTLIELIITVCIVGILLTIAIPNFKTMVANNRSVTLGNNFYSALQMAKTEAIKRHARVSVCPLDAAASSCGTDWSLGWLVVVDGATTDTAGSVVLSKELNRMEKPSSGAVVNLGSASFVRFTSTGLQGGNGSVAVTKADISQTGCTKQSAVHIEVTVAGMITSKRASCP